MIYSDTRGLLLELFEDMLELCMCCASASKFYVQVEIRSVYRVSRSRFSIL